MFVSEQHPGSRRYAIFEDDGTAGFLYLTRPDDTKPVRDCWIYNRIPAPEPSEIQSYRGSPPPAARGFAGPQAHQEQPPEAAVTFLWSVDGDAVCLVIGDVPAGFIVLGDDEYGGYSRNLIAAGGWGKPWDEARFQAVFGTSAETDL
jgi:hypothetical protein